MCLYACDISLPSIVNFLMNRTNFIIPCLQNSEAFELSDQRRKCSFIHDLISHKKSNTSFTLIRLHIKSLGIYS